MLVPSYSTLLVLLVLARSEDERINAVAVGVPNVPYKPMRIVNTGRVTPSIFTDTTAPSRAI